MTLKKRKGMNVKMNRKTKMLLVACGLLGALAFAKVDAAGVAAPTAQTAEAPELTGPAVDLDGAETSAICPQKWTCNYRNWYGTEANCNASCGGPCFLDYRCTVGCVCP